MIRQLRRRLVITFLSVCPEGCYKHLRDGKWVCCKCGDGA